jgi:NADPH:quinone reductase-like Zn-dependent oxidoreductase
VKAVQFAEYGGPEVLTLVEVGEPHAGPGQIRVAVWAAGVNPVDWKIRSGAMRQANPLELPWIPGSDVAGVVDEVGDDVSGVSVGDEVFGFAVSGGYARYAVLERFARKPAAMSWAEAAGLPVAVETAVRCLDLLGVKAGQTLLVNGAAGGVGVAATQFARARGASVIGTASERNHDFLRSLGAIPVAYGAGLVQRVREIAPHGVDVAFDTAGHGALADLVELTGNPEDVVTIADFTAAEHGVRLTYGQDGRTFQALGQAAQLFEDGRFSMPVAQTLPLAQAAQAHRLSQDGHVRGKLVLTVE